MSMATSMITQSIYMKHLIQYNDYKVQRHDKLFT